MLYMRSERTHEHSSWLESTVEYRGWGWAAFEEPKVWLAGPTFISFDEAGTVRSEMKVVRWESEEVLPLGLMQIFNSDRPVPGDQPSSWSQSLNLDSKANDCVQLIVKTGTGIFRAEGPMGYSHTLSFGDKNSSVTLRFSPYSGWYSDSTDVSHPVFWAMPITNFVSSWSRVNEESIVMHPLRLHSIDEYMTSASEERLPAFFEYLAKNQMIAFDYRDQKVFIEPVIEYKDVEGRLQRGESAQAFTSVIIGRLPENLLTEEDYWDYLPDDILVILGLATGTRVGMQWLELRDETGRLAVRLHKRMGIRFEKGHVAVDQLPNNGIGTLLADGCTSDIFDSETLRVFGAHLIRAGSSQLTIEDTLSHLVRALDGLIKKEGISSQIDYADVLTAERQTEYEILRDTMLGGLDSLTRTCKIDGEYEVVSYLEGVRDRVKAASIKRSALGDSLKLLLERYELQDLVVLEPYFNEHGPKKRKSWFKCVSYLRGLVIHDGYVDFHRHSDARDFAYPLMLHLHDLLLRVMLKKLAYSGSYQPTMASLKGEWSLDWVSPDTPPHRLGFE
jgi:hypothetical protein